MIKAILLDIEGTTTPIDFVYQTLFPFARRQMREFLTNNFAAIQTEISQLKEEHARETAKPPKLNETAESFADYLLWLMDEDRKSTPLKSLQGKIWEKGYESGELKSVVFADVVRAFERWKAEEKTIAIYSSGSVLAQKLLFKYTNHDDLTHFISNYFDTQTGAKSDSESYLKIVSALRFAPAETLAFVSDVSEELDAAEVAGFQTFLAIRQGNKPINHQINHQPIHSFDEIL